MLEEKIQLSGVIDSKHRHCIQIQNYHFNLTKSTNYNSLQDVHIH